MKNTEELLIKVIHFMAERFKTLIALEGGMLLRLLNCPRSTQDVDYVLISGESKKILAKNIERLLSSMEDMQIDSISLNSRGIFIDVSDVDNQSVKAKIEISVQPSLNLPTESISTVTLASRHSLSGRIISTIALAEAFANKIAAALERDSARDLYDLSQLESLCNYDIATLKKRLVRLSINRKKSKPISFKEAADTLKEKGMKLTEEALEQELYPLLPPEQRGGMLPIIKAALNRIATKIESADT